MTDSPKDTKKAGSAEEIDKNEDMGKTIDTLTTESVTLLREMIAIPSPSFKEEAVSCHVSAFLTRSGIANFRLKNNIIAIQPSYSPDKKTMMLCAHLDTVSPSDDYTFDPYTPDYTRLDYRHEWLEAIGVTSSSEIVAGLGANDDGASAAAMIAAFRHFYDKELPFNLMLVLGAEEERSGKDGMETVWKAFETGDLHACDGAVSFGQTRISPPDWAIVGEPTAMKAAIAERGLLVIDGLAEGVSGHAAREEGVNALYIAMDDIRKLRDFRFSKVSPLMGKVKLTVTQINAGTVHNVVPDRCSFVVDIRPTEQYTNSEILGMLQSECRSTLSARNLRNRSSATPDGSPLIECASRLDMETFISPTTSDWMRIGCDAIKMGPGDSARSHRKDEYVTIPEIRDGIEKYIGYIGCFAGMAPFTKNSTD